jgi:hypothetical protein
MQKSLFDPVLIAELAQQIAITDPIDWGELSINEQEAYHLMSLHVSELLDVEQPLLVAHATIVKLLVENFVLNLHIEKSWDKH